MLPAGSSTVEARLQRPGQLASEPLVGTANLAGLGSSLHERPCPLLRPAGLSWLRKARRSDDRCAAPAFHLNHLTAWASSVT
jgi:hypothetical protein